MKKIKKTKDPKAAKPEVDGWANITTGLGVAGKDKRESAVPEVDLMDYGSLGQLYRGSDLASRIVDLPAEDMTREWGDVRIPEDEELSEEVGEAMEDLDTDAAFLQAMKWKRAYGGSVIFIGANDGVADLSKPLNEDNLQSIDSLNVFDAFEARPLATEWQDNPVKPDFGQPTKYQLNPHIFAAQIKPLQEVHASRFLVFQGPLSNRRQLRNGGLGIAAGWGDSVLVRLVKHIRDYDQAWGGVSHLLTDVAQDVIGMADLANMLLADKKNTILKRLQMVQLSRSIVNATIVDKENESFERKGTPLAGVADILREEMDRISAACGIPTVVLFGVSPGGMNATGENDMQIWYDAVAAMQRRELKKNVKRLTKLVMLCKDGPTAGKLPESWSFKFRPLWQQSDAEKATTRLANAQSDQIYLAAGVVSTEDVAVSRFCGDEYGTDLNVDLDALEEREAQAQELSDATHEATVGNLTEHGQATPPKPAPVPPGKPVKDAASTVFKIKDRVRVKATGETGAILYAEAQGVQKLAVRMDSGANTVNERVLWLGAEELEYAPR